MFDVEVIERPRKLYRNVRCDGCNVALECVGPSVEEDGAWSCLQPNDALEIHLVGGYGMAIDPCGGASESDLTQLFCGKCVEKLCGQWPSIARVVMAHVSSGLAHTCSKERAFVWKPLGECCASFCAGCFKRVSSYSGTEDSEEEFSHRVAECKYWPDPSVVSLSGGSNGCGHTGPALWSWELTPVQAAIAAAKDESRRIDLEKEMAAREAVAPSRGRDGLL